MRLGDESSGIVSEISTDEDKVEVTPLPVADEADGSWETERGKPLPKGGD